MVCRPPFTLPIRRETPWPLPEECPSVSWCESLRPSSGYNGAPPPRAGLRTLGTPVCEHTGQEPPSPEEPRPDPARGRECAWTYPLHIPAPRGARASGARPAAALSLRRPGPRPRPPPTPPRPGRAARAAVSPARSQSVPAAPSAAPTLPRRVTCRAEAEATCRPRPPPARDSAAAGRGGQLGRQHPAASAAPRCPQLSPLWSPAAPAQRSTRPRHHCSRNYNGSGIFNSLIPGGLSPRPPDPLPHPHRASWPSPVPWAPCSVPVRLPHPAWSGGGQTPRQVFSVLLSERLFPGRTHLWPKSPAPVFSHGGLASCSDHALSIPASPHHLSGGNQPPHTHLSGPKSSAKPLPESQTIGLPAPQSCHLSGALLISSNFSLGLDPVRASSLPLGTMLSPSVSRGGQVDWEEILPIQLLPELGALIFQSHRAGGSGLSLSGLHLGTHISFIWPF